MHVLKSYEQQPSPPELETTGGFTGAFTGGLAGAATGAFTGEAIGGFIGDETGGGGGEFPGPSDTETRKERHLTQLAK